MEEGSECVVLSCSGADLTESDVGDAVEWWVLVGVGLVVLEEDELDAASPQVPIDLMLV